MGVSLLASYHADLHAVNDYGQTPLHMAVMSGFIETALRLLELGADIDARDGFGRTPFLTASALGLRKMAAFLKSRG